MRGRLGKQDLRYGCIHVRVVRADAALGRHQARPTGVDRRSSPGGQSSLLLVSRRVADTRCAGFCAVTVRAGGIALGERDPFLFVLVADQLVRLCGGHAG